MQDLRAATKSVKLCRGGPLGDCKIPKALKLSRGSPLWDSHKSRRTERKASQPKPTRLGKGPMGRLRLVRRK